MHGKGSKPLNYNKSFVRQGLSAFAFGPIVELVLKICLNGSALLNKMLIYSKTHLTIFFSRTKKVLRLKLGTYIALGTEGSNDDHWMTFDLLTTKSNLCSSC